jgi:hypothetical protein
MALKKAILLIVFQAWWAAGFSQNLRFTEPFATHIPARADLDVRWIAPTNKIPPSVWVYHLLPRPLSPQSLSNLMAACSFTDKDGTWHGDELIFKSSDGFRMLRVYPPWGVIEYRTTFPRSWTNLIKDVPSTSKALKLTKQFLLEVGIDLADIDRQANGKQPNFYVYDMGVTYFVNGKQIHNTEAREVRFRRMVDGISFTSVNTGGDAEIDFGGSGRISKISISWRNMRRDKSYPTTTPDMMVKSLREGRAIQGEIPDNMGGIDWPTVKSVTIKKAEPCYYAGGDPFAPSDSLQPYMALWTTVDTGHGIIDVEIDCPLIEPAKRDGA